MAKNLKGKTVTRENAYETIVDGTWTFYVLKHYKSTEAELADPYARVFCLVVSPMAPRDLGDTYINNVPGLRARLKAEFLRVTEEEYAKL